jgi:hypothetical protein
VSQNVILSLAAWGAVVLSSYGAQAQPNDLNARLGACRSIGDVQSRVACYDGLVDGLGAAVTPSAASLRAAAPPPAMAAPAPNPPAPHLPAQANLFGGDDLPPPKREPDAAPIPDHIIAKASAVRTDAAGLVIVTLDNGQTWRQTDGSALRVKPGAEVKIRSGLMGSYLMSLASGNRSVRAKRIN